MSLWSCATFLRANLDLSMVKQYFVTRSMRGNSSYFIIIFNENFILRFWTKIKDCLWKNCFQTIFISGVTVFKSLFCFMRCANLELTFIQLSGKFMKWIFNEKNEVTRWLWNTRDVKMGYLSREFAAIQISFRARKNFE